MLNIQRVHMDRKDSRNGNIALRYFAEPENTWIWCTGSGAESEEVLEFMCDFEAPQDMELCFSLTADQRYEAFLDGEFFGMGPDRCDLNHWAFATYRVSLKKGHHEFRVWCWRFQLANRPVAQLSFQGGFLFGVEDPAFRKILNTSSGNWKCRRHDGVSFEVSPDDTWSVWTSLISSVSVISGRSFFTEKAWEKPAVVNGPRYQVNYGGRIEGWALCPSDLPEQIRVVHEDNIGTARAFFSGSNGMEQIVAERELNAPELAEWNHFLKQGGILEIKPHQNLAVLLDLEEYHCGYPFVEVDGGDEGCSIRISWAEALFLPGSAEKKHRGEISGKRFSRTCQGDCFKDFDGEKRRYRSFWWRAGRYMLVGIRTGEKPFRLRKIGFLESRYPLEMESEIRTSDAALDGLQPMMIRSMQMCCHETYMDCPFYEQLMYVGDSRLECLTGYVMSRDFRLQQRAVDLFDWSRCLWDNLVSERYPSAVAQLSATFSMIWPLMVQDFVMYRRCNPDWFSEIRRSARCLILTLEKYWSDRGHLRNLPGWSFVDWVPGHGWSVNGLPPPGENGGDSSIYTLHYLGAVRAASALEEIHPDTASEGMKIFYSGLAQQIRTALIRDFYVPEQHRFADSAEKNSFSCHAQVLALLYDALPEEERRACYNAMMTDLSAAQPTIYFSYYLHEVMSRFGDGGRIPEKLGFWHDIQASGALTTWEQPEPSRSDCHAWGAHPLFHFFTTLAGIRPAEPGFRKVRVSPQMGPLEYVRGHMAHPDGDISFDFHSDAKEFHGSLILPENLSGCFELNGIIYELHGGKNTIIVKK